MTKPEHWDELPDAVVSRTDWIDGVDPAGRARHLTRAEREAEVDSTLRYFLNLENWKDGIRLPDVGPGGD